MRFFLRKHLLILTFALIVAASALGFLAEQSLFANGFEMYLPAILNGGSGGTLPGS